MYIFGHNYKPRGIVPKIYIDLLLPNSPFDMYINYYQTNQTKSDKRNVSIKKKTVYNDTMNIIPLTDRLRNQASKLFTQIYLKLKKFCKKSLKNVKTIIIEMAQNCQKMAFGSFI